jgi:hypothetical protein
MLEPIENWLEGFPYKEAVERLEKLETQRRELDIQISQLRGFINLYTRNRPAKPATAVEAEADDAFTLGESPSERVEDQSSEAAPSPTQNGGKPTFRQAILEVLRSRTGPWSVIDLRAELEHSGQITRDQKGSNKLLTMVSLMNKAGQIERVKMGLYKLPTTEQSRL